MANEVNKYDINGDGVVDMSDAALVNQYMGKKAGSSAIAKKCDLNGDGKVDALDYHEIINYIKSLGK